MRKDLSVGMAALLASHAVFAAPTQGAAPPPPAPVPPAPTDDAAAKAAEAKAAEKAAKEEAKAKAKAEKDAAKAEKAAAAEKAKAEKEAKAKEKAEAAEKVKADREAAKAAKLVAKEEAKAAKLAAKGPSKKSIVRDMLTAGGGTTVKAIVEKLGVADTAARSLINDVRAWGYIVTSMTDETTKTVTYTAVRAVADPNAVPAAPPAA